MAKKKKNKRSTQARKASPKSSRKKTYRRVASGSRTTSEVERLKNQIKQLKEQDRLSKLKLNVFREIERLSHSKSDYDQILNRTMDLALKALNTESGTLFVYHAGLDQLEFRVVKGAKKAVQKLQGQMMDAKDGIVGHVFKTGKSYVTHDAHQDQKWHKTISQSVGYETHDILCVPLRSSRSKILGCIQVINRKNAEPYTHDDLEVLQSIADQIGIVMENAQLFFKLSSRMKQLSDLHHISQLLTSSLDTVEIRRSALEAVVDLMNCETGSLYQIDEKNKELYFDVALGKQGEKVKKIRLKIGEGVAGWVAKHKKPVLIADCAKDPRFFQKADKLSNFKTRNMVCAPLLSKGKVIGVLQAINRKVGTFDNESLKLFVDLANQVAIALKNAMLFEELRKNFYESVTALAEAIELRDPYTGGHTQRVRRYSLAIGKYLDLSEDDMEILSLSAILHDVGKIGVADHILRKKGKLDYEEFLEMKKHPEYGYQMLKEVSSLSMAYDGILYHHERFDGKGYPKGLKGLNIPLVARIIAVADTFDAMTTNRPYREGLSLDFVLKEIKDCSGSQFDREVVKAFLKAFENGEIVMDT